MRRLAVLVAWLALLTASIAVLAATATGALAGPPLLEPSGWPAWAAGRDPVDAAMAITRVALLAVCAYLLAMTVLSLLVRLVSLPRAAARIEAVSGPLVRRIVGGALGAGIALTSLAPPPPAWAADGPPPTAVMRLLDGAAASPLPTAPPSRPATGADEHPSTDASAPTAPTPPAPAIAATTAATPAARPATVTGGEAAPSLDVAPATMGNEHVVQPGQSFWRIAELHLEAELGRTPTTRETARYWRTLVAANADRLVVASQPDLIYPGQRFRLP